MKYLIFFIAMSITGVACQSTDRDSKQNSFTYQGATISLASVQHTSKFQPPGAPIVVSPKEGEEFIEVSLKLKWSSPDGEMSISKSSIKLFDTENRSYIPSVAPDQYSESADKWDSKDVLKVPFAVSVGRKEKQLCFDNACLLFHQ